MKVLITGINGLLGQKMVQHTPHWAKVIGVDIHEQAKGYARRAPYFQLDICDFEGLRDIVEREQLDWIVNTAAFTHVDGCERQREDCWRVNVEGVRTLCRAAAPSGVRLAHVSTDYVFDGLAGPYSEEDRPAPLGYYGQTKLESEKVLADAGVDYVIVRTNVLYGHAPEVRPNFVHWVLAKLCSGEPFRVVTDQVGNPTLADDLACAIWTLIAAEARGIYHASGSDFVNRYTFAVTAAEIFGHDPSQIGTATTAELGQTAPRPLKSGLLCDKLSRRYGVRLRGVREGLEAMKAEMDLIDRT